MTTPTRKTQHWFPLHAYTGTTGCSWDQTRVLWVIFIHFYLFYQAFSSCIFSQQNSRRIKRPVSVMHNQKKKKKAQSNWYLCLKHAGLLTFAFGFAFFELCHLWPWGANTLPCFWIPTGKRLFFFTRTFLNSHICEEELITLLFSFLIILFEHSTLMICHCLESDFAFTKIDSFWPRKTELNSNWRNVMAFVLHNPKQVLV